MGRGEYIMGKRGKGECIMGRRGKGSASWGGGGRGSTSFVAKCVSMVAIILSYFICKFLFGSHNADCALFRRRNIIITIDGKVTIPKSVI